jgi:hypothetical protein
MISNALKVINSVNNLNLENLFELIEMKFSRMLDSDKYATKLEVQDALNKLRLKVYSFLNKVL